MTTFRNDMKKDSLSHKARLVFANGKIFKGESKNSATFKEELFATIGKVANGFI